MLRLLYAIYFIIFLQLTSEEGAEEAYNYLLSSVNSLGLEKWMQIRQTDFYSRFPELEIQTGDNTEK